MRHHRSSLAALAAAGLLLAASPSSAQEMPPLPKPGPEHQLFQKDAGTWDATIEMFMAPGTDPMVSKGVETDRVGCGGLCLITDFEGEMMPGMTFEGHGTTVWDPAKKKYVGTWTDSMSTGMALGESSYDEAAGTLSGWMEGPDMTGNVMKSRSLVEYQGADTRVFSMFATGPDGQEVLGMKITYARRK
jgi:hypothetical protein